MNKSKQEIRMTMRKILKIWGKSFAGSFMRFYVGFLIVLLILNAINRIN